MFVIVKSRNPNTADLCVRVLDMATEAVVSEERFGDGGAKELNVPANHAVLVTEITRPAAAPPPAVPAGEERQSTFLGRLFGWKK